MKSRGFTITELLVTMALFAIMIPVISGIIIFTGNLNRNALSYSILNSFAENKIESLRSAGFSALPIGTSNISAELPDDVPAPKSAEMVVTSEATGLKKIVLTINYNESGGSRTLTYATFVGELGVGQY